MLKKLLFLLPATLAPALLLTGAWRGPAAANVPAPSPFLAQSVAVNHDLLGRQATGADLLNCALQQFAADKLSWLRMRIWQRSTEERNAFESDGTLDLGPGECARLEMRIRTPAGSARLLTVCDGHILAHAIQRAGSSADVATDALPDGDDRAARRNLLEERGCGGPASLLSQLRKDLHDIRVQTGMLKKLPVIQLKGHLGAKDSHEYAALYLDAQNLWPHRVEWWQRDKQRGWRLQRQLEFRSPELNHARSRDECVHLFTYDPDGTR
jgi:hypothetical protein